MSVSWIAILMLGGSFMKWLFVFWVDTIVDIIIKFPKLIYSIKTASGLITTNLTVESFSDSQAKWL